MELAKVGIRFWNIASCSYRQLLEQMEEWRKMGGHHLVCFCDANGLAHGWRESDVQSAYCNADAVVADGIVIKWLVRVCGGKLPERVFGPSLFLRAMEYGIPLGWRHFLYGGASGVAEELKRRMEARFPGVQIIGADAPPFSSDPPIPNGSPRNDGVRPYDFLWVALGSPKQEKWCARHLAEFNASVILPVGAAFDFHTDRAPRAPQWVDAVGLCWLWRLLTGGRRVFKRNIWCLPRAAFILITEFLRIRIFRCAVKPFKPISDDINYAELRAKQDLARKLNV